MVLEEEGNLIADAMRRFHISERLKECMHLTDGSVSIDPNCYSKIYKEFWNSDEGMKLRKLMSERMKKVYEQFKEMR